MSYLRVQIDLAVKQPIPTGLQTELPQIMSAIKALKSYASKINEGQANEEVSVYAGYHVCCHDEG